MFILEAVHVLDLINKSCTEERTPVQDSIPLIPEPEQ